VIEISDNGKYADGNAAKKLEDEQLDHVGFASSSTMRALAGALVADQFLR
jgi:hypothetical protein